MEKKKEKTYYLNTVEEYELKEEGKEGEEEVEGEEEEDKREKKKTKFEFNVIDPEIGALHKKIKDMNQEDKMKEIQNYFTKIGVQVTPQEIYEVLYPKKIKGLALKQDIKELQKTKQCVCNVYDCSRKISPTFGDSLLQSYICSEHQKLL